MKYYSTKGKAPGVGFSAALRQGLAPDGGLYVPESFPQLGKSFENKSVTLQEVSQAIASQFLKGDALETQVSEICRETLNFPIPLLKLNSTTALLELFHGPTAAFKDVGARFLSNCLTRDIDPGKKEVVLVATSGDTGGAVASAFYKKSGVSVVILFPEGRISPRQKQQLCCWGENILSIAVQGTFDDCQSLVKQAFLSNPSFRLTSANSINIGRILPQTFYYAWASLSYKKDSGKVPGFIIPTGNLGNAMAAIWAKKMGFPIRKIVLACNANHTLLDYLKSGEWKPQPTLATLANAMDVGNPSNAERLRHLYPDLAELKKEIEAYSVSDDEIRKTIGCGEKNWKQIFCPHTACAVSALGHVSAEDWILVSTAHPAKFEAIVEPLIGHAVEIPPALSRLLSKKESFLRLDSRSSLTRLMEIIQGQPKG